ncbi:hypothetical protein L7F22_026091 [Adiantum nelumboides]|nr:hypothetical protein [Adiantum nelumboides]
MEPQWEATDAAGIELFISIPIHSSDPHFLREMHHTNKGDDFRSIKRKARLDRAVINQLIDCVNQGPKEEMDERGATCGSDILLGSKKSGFTSSPSSSSMSSSSLSSSVSDLFTLDEKDMMEFIDERSKPRFRLLTELY